MISGGYAFAWGGTCLPRVQHPGGTRLPRTDETTDESPGWGATLSLWHSCLRNFYALAHCQGLIPILCKTRAWPRAKHVTVTVQMSRPLWGVSNIYLPISISTVRFLYLLVDIYISGDIYIYRQISISARRYLYLPSDIYIC